ncbi:MAG: hypothetical protein AMXMBFR4_14430 [Candidatus Hydrogenedentota bacterium]
MGIVCYLDPTPLHGDGSFVVLYDHAEYGTEDGHKATGGADFEQAPITSDIEPDLASLERKVAGIVDLHPGILAQFNPRGARHGEHHPGTGCRLEPVPARNE